MATVLIWAEFHRYSWAENLEHVDKTDSTEVSFVKSM